MMLLHRICQTSLFELVIRGVGGLLSAYDLSKDSIFLTRCFDPSPSPCYLVCPIDQPTCGVDAHFLDSS